MMLRAIVAAKKKNDWIDAGKIADCGAATSCRNATWHPAIRDRRRTLGGDWPVKPTIRPEPGRQPYIPVSEESVFLRVFTNL